MTSIEKEIQKARPSLKMVTPLAHAIILVFAVFNILFGLSLFFAIDQTKITASLLIVNNVFSYKFWGVVFILIGLLKLFALKTNNWDLSRKSLIVGVAIKAAWAVALVVRSFTSPGTFLVSIIWVALAAIQISTFIFFMPPAIPSPKQPEVGDE